MSEPWTQSLYDIGYITVYSTDYTILSTDAYKGSHEGIFAKIIFPSDVFFYSADKGSHKNFISWTSNS